MAEPAPVAAPVKKTGVKKKGKVKKKAAPAGLPWTVRVGQKWDLLTEGLLDLLKGMISSDPKTRRMSILFFASFCCALATVWLASSWYYANWRQQRLLDAETEVAQGDNISKLVTKQKEAAHSHYSTLGIGVFTVELKPVPDARPAPGVMNMAEIEIVLECDAKVACKFIEQNVDRVRDQVSSVFTAIDREELMSMTGKRRIKQRIIKKLNLLNPKGGIKEVYFTKMVIS